MDATIWEDKGNDCFECKAEDQSVYLTECNDIDETGFIVELVVKGMDVADLNLSELQYIITKLASIDEDKLKIHVVINEKSGVVRIEVIVNDETTAEILYKAIKDLPPEEKRNSFLEHVVNARVKVEELELSSGVVIEASVSMMYLMILLITVIHG